MILGQKDGFLNIYLKYCLSEMFFTKVNKKKIKAICLESVLRILSYKFLLLLKYYCIF